MISGSTVAGGPSAPQPPERPRPGRKPSTSTSPLDRAEGRQRQRPTYPIDSRRSWALIAVVAAIVAAVVASQHQARQASGAPLPSTPRQWVEQWTAASLDNPGRVCRQLFAPALAGVFKADTGRSCLDYYNDVNAKSFRIRHVLVDGNAAAVEVREVGLRPNWGYVTMILSHVQKGWQAVDIVPGGPVRPR